MLEKEDLVIPPNPKILVRAIARAAKAKLRGRKLIVPREVEEARLAFCEAPCQFLTDDGEQCKRCTCFISAKVVLSTESCPVDKWGEWKLTDDKKGGT